MFHSGDKIGPYDLIKRLGRGGFGEVWLAEKRTSLSTTRFALKLPSDDDVRPDVIRAEADVWCSVSGHPNVLPIIEADIHDGQIVIASEFVDGGSLADHLRKNSGAAASIEEAIYLFRGILRGLSFLHARHVVHRDLKPENILLQEGVPRLTDFGIARILRDGPASTKQISGTISYMPPEAFEGLHSFQTDIWSAGVILYQMLTGKLPFQSDDHLTQMLAITSKDPSPLPDTVPGGLRAFIYKALSKDRARRFQSVNEMTEQFESAITGDGYTNAKTEILHREAMTDSHPERSTASPHENVEQATTEVLPPRITDGKPDKNGSSAGVPVQTGGQRSSGSRLFWVVAIMILAAGSLIAALIWNGSNGRSNEQVAASPAKSGPASRYREMSASERRAFVAAEAQKVLSTIGNGPEAPISEAGIDAIQSEVEYFVKRSLLERKDSCGNKTWTQSDLTTVLRRGAKIAPDLAAGFSERGLSPVVGIYMAMTESEFCPCLQMSTGPMGIYSFTAETARNYGLRASSNSSPNDPDDRCNPEPAARAAAAYLKKLVAEDFGEGANKISLAIAAFNSGEGGLRANIATLRRSNADATISYWALLDQSGELSEQFKVENSRYLPRFIAAAIVGENPSVFGMDLPPLSSHNTR
jgi:serine/threonine protein kinase